METTNILTKEQILTIVENDPLYFGNDNNGIPKVNYLIKINRMSDEELVKECENKIHLSAYASNNSRSDYHWQCDFCYDECIRRGKEDIYIKAYNLVSK